jgi:hypothetical protein
LLFFSAQFFQSNAVQFPSEDDKKSSIKYSLFEQRSLLLLPIWRKRRGQLNGIRPLTDSKAKNSD